MVIGRELLSLLVGVQIITAIVEISLEISQKKNRNKIITGPSHFTPAHVQTTPYPAIETCAPQVHCCFIYYSKELESTSLAING